ncbi:hypothetical protein [Sphingomonas sp.]|uniref:hypothetical protein n=1 Tax=Sphingomonas sp. TaxID=28214 RepID=UPI0025E9E732|nr:hypothetical protein [Sphingomonas sp.]
MRIAAVLALCLISACSNAPTVIDGSSPQAFEKTAEQARRDLSVKDRLTFDTALNTVGGRRYADNDPDATARQIYNGMTAEDVVADAHARGIE